MLLAGGRSGDQGQAAWEGPFADDKIVCDWLAPATWALDQGHCSTESAKRPPALLC
jgi:hypothetical protein